MLKPGRPAPDFTLTTGDGETVRLRELRGQPVVLYFYPKDDTPGCTKEACFFRDLMPEFEKKGAAVYGISADSEKSHARFSNKYGLTFPLLSDPGHQVATAYDSWGPKKFMGREYEGILRNTFLIGKDGKVAKVWEKVKPAEHAAEVLEEI
ncbi:MAG: thioredoxin-dependent thiol peroxidase [Candidatus Dormiibacterota bacterium]